MPWNDSLSKQLDMFTDRIEKARPKKISSKEEIQVKIKILQEKLEITESQFSYCLSCDDKILASEFLCKPCKEAIRDSNGNLQ